MSGMDRNLEACLVTSIDSPEFTRFTRCLARSSILGLDAEWKPLRSSSSSFPTVTLLQIACRLSQGSDDDSAVFLLDLTSISLPLVWEQLRDVFVSPDVLKLGFRFKQDLIYLSSTFCGHGCDGFDEVKPYLDITSMYNHLQHKRFGRKVPKDIKSLATICKELLGISLSKELQCSDWLHRPLTKEQQLYAATDAQCLLQIFDLFKARLAEEGITELETSDLNVGLKEILEKSDPTNRIVTVKLCKASDVIRAMSGSFQSLANGVVCRKTAQSTVPMDETLLKIVRKYGEKILLRDSDLQPKTSKKKVRRRASSIAVDRDEQSACSRDWQGPPPWDPALGGDGCPKFLLDVMVVGLAKHLRCVGIDAAVPCSKKPDPRELLDQAYKEKRILLTRDAKLLRHQYMVENQIYRVNSLLKNEQLLEVIETFELKISEDQLMSRCTKCNGKFMQKPLSIEEAIEAAKGFQRIPNCLFNKNLEFWQCMDCRQLYWEGTQYHNAVQKFIEVCKLNE